MAVLKGFDGPNQVERCPPTPPRQTGERSERRINRVCCLECEKAVQGSKDVGLENWGTGLTFTNIKNIGGSASFV